MPNALTELDQNQVDVLRDMLLEAQRKIVAPCASLSSVGVPVSINRLSVSIDDNLSGWTREELDEMIKDLTMHVEIVVFGIHSQALSSGDWPISDELDSNQPEPPMTPTLKGLPDRILAKTRRRRSLDPAKVNQRQPGD